MGLIKCPECGREVSEFAETCPGCGFKISEGIEKRIDQKYPTNRHFKKRYLVIVLCVLIVIITGGYFVIEYLKDKEPPVIENVPEKVELKIGNEFEVEKFLSNVKVTDNISENLNYTVSSNNVDITTPGEYFIEIKASDEAGNISSEKIKVIISDYPVHIAYLNATNLDKSQIQMDSSNGYSFNGIDIADEEIEWLEDGAIYRSIAKQLEDFYLEKDLYENWGETTVEKVWGFEKPQTWDELRPYIDETILLISRKQSVGEILSTFQNLSCVEGTFDYANGEFDFIIHDLTEAATQLRITEEMLGYILAYLEEYGPTTQFNQNSYTCEYKWVGADRSYIDDSEFEFYSNFSESENVINIIPDRGYFYFEYAPMAVDESNNYLHLTYYTKRGICVRDSIEAVKFAYGGGEVKQYNKNGDIVYEGFVFNNDKNYAILDFCTQYITYRIGDVGNIMFFFDSNNSLLMIGYSRMVFY